jgi:hypothetical protein
MKNVEERPMVTKEQTTEEILVRLTGLYQKNPGEFEELRKTLIERTIEEFPAEHRKRAHGLQFRIESRLRKYKDPVVRMNKMVEIFWEQFGLFHDVLQNPTKVIAEREQKKNKAVVVPFAGKETSRLQRTS